MFQRILLPLDGSGMAENILPAAEQFARRFDSTVVLFHGVERGPPPEVHGDRHLTGTVDAEAYLEGLASRLRANGVEVESHVHPS